MPFLGRIDPANFAGGRMGLDLGLAGQAVAGIAKKLGLATEAMAQGILDIVNARMADAIRTITIRRGIDPRDFALFAYGGAGPMHAVALAEELEIGEVIVPLDPGAFSAWGMLQTDLRHDVVRSFYRPLAELDQSEVAGAFGALLDEADALLEREDVALGRPLLPALGRHALRRAGVHGQRRRRRGELARGDRRLVPRGSPHPLRALDARRAGRVRQPPHRRNGADRAPPWRRSRDRPAAPIRCSGAAPSSSPGSSTTRRCSCATTCTPAAL